MNNTYRFPYLHSRKGGRISFRSHSPTPLRSTSSREFTDKFIFGSSNRPFDLHLPSPVHPAGRGQLAPHTRHRGLCAQVPDALILNLPTQLVIGYHWLTFLNQARKISGVSIQYDVDYKIDHISQKLKK